MTKAPPAIHNIALYKGADFIKTLRYPLEIDIAGFVFSAQIIAVPANTSVLDFDCIIDIENNILDIATTKEAVRYIATGTYKWELFQTDTTGFTVQLITGSCIIKD